MEVTANCFTLLMTAFRRTDGSPKNAMFCGLTHECCSTGTHGGFDDSLSAPQGTYGEPAGVPGFDRITCTGVSGASMPMSTTSSGLSFTPPWTRGSAKKSL